MNKYREELKFIPAFVLIVGIIWFTGCPVKLLTGISCAGCGMTRAWISLLRLDFTEAFHYHPFFAAPAIFVVSYILKKNGHEKKFRISCIVIVILLLVVWVIRLFNPDGIVEFALKDGLIYRVLNRIYSH
ncbi:MAG: DUF2752 domain-containing protein [Clostridia bacterium]|nr:DUF2752 domain-containing protein [Clostridia bacterium]